MAATLSFWTKSCYMKDMHVFERDVNGLRYRIAAQSVWDPVRGRSVARQTVLGPATAAPVADLAATRTVGTQAVGDVGALIWVAEQLDLIGHIDQACGNLGAKGGPSVGELALAVAIQRACSPGPKRDLASFWMGPYRACRVCLLRPSVAKPIIAWPGKSLMSNWSTRKSRWRKRLWPGSSFRPTCWRSTPRISTLTLRR